MSYCRWSDGDIYCWEGMDDLFVVAVKGGEFFQFSTPGEAADKMEALRRDGLDVQQFAIDTLREEQAEL